MVAGIDNTERALSGMALVGGSALMLFAGHRFRKLGQLDRTAKATGALGCAVFAAGTAGLVLTAQAEARITQSQKDLNNAGEDADWPKLICDWFELTKYKPMEVKNPHFHAHLVCSLPSVINLYRKLSEDPELQSITFPPLLPNLPDHIDMTRALASVKELDFEYIDEGVLALIGDKGSCAQMIALAKIIDTDWPIEPGTRRGSRLTLLFIWLQSHTPTGSETQQIIAEYSAEKVQRVNDRWQWELDGTVFPLDPSDAHAPEDS